MKTRILFTHAILSGFAALWIAGLLQACTEDRTVVIAEYEIDTDGDGVLDQAEIENGTDITNACDPLQSPFYTGFDPLNTIWAGSDCDQDGISNGDENTDGSNPYLNDTLDSDGDGIPDQLEAFNGTDKYDPCDPYHGPGYTGFNGFNNLWAGGDCDLDGVSNGAEHSNGTDPYENDSSGIDSDGDGIGDEMEAQQGSNPQDPCDPAQPIGYLGYDAGNASWAAADCDQDGVLNGDEVAGSTDPYKDDRVYVVPDFVPTLTELQLFKGPLSELAFQPTVHAYEVRTPLFTDYAHKIRSVALPQGSHMAYAGTGVFAFPNDAVLTETLFYYLDERDPALGRRIIETRVLIRKNGNWTAGKYIWNENQTEAVLEEGTQVVEVNWTDATGAERSVNYKVPPNVICAQCHNLYGSLQPLGISAPQLNFVSQGANQLDRLAADGVLQGAPASSQVPVFPDASDESETLENRARAYLDANCSHCHQPGGSYNTTYGDHFDLRFETAYGQSRIGNYLVSIENRMNSSIPSYFMPYLGTTVVDADGVELVNQYVQSLQLGGF